MVEKEKLLKNLDFLTPEKERELLDDLNDFLVLVPYVFENLVYVSYQEKITKSFVKKSIFNYASSFFCASCSSFVAEYLMNKDVSTLGEIISVGAAGFFGACLLQRDNRKSFLENSMDIDNLYEKADILNDKFLEISLQIMERVSSFSNISSSNIDSFLVKDIVRDIFVRNNDYVKQKIDNKYYDSDFSLKVIDNAFNLMFDYENGFSEFIVNSLNYIDEHEDFKREIKIKRR